MMMKPRKHKAEHKQDSEPAVEVEVQGDQGETEKPANPREIQGEIQNPVSSFEIQDEVENFVGAVAMQDKTEKPGRSSEVSADRGVPARRGGPAADSASPAGADRRNHPRYAFTAAVEVVTGEPGARMKTRVRDLSQQGCYVDTDSPLPLGTVAEVRITKGAKSLETRARVVYNQPGRGMGLMFTALEPEQLGILGTWIAESRETSWLAVNRRRSQRVLMKLPVRLSGPAGAASDHEEETHTVAISAHGALIAVSAPLHRGQRLTLTNVQTKASLECAVVHIERFPGEQIKVGVEFMLPNPTFWHVAFPPKDWTPRHPDAKSRPKTGESR